MQTKRKYAHELYPHAAEGEVRPLSVEVPYRYSRAFGFETLGTSWSDQAPREFSDRVNRLIDARHLALLADAMAQGMTNDEAWEWATSRAQEESGEWIYERAVHYGVDPEQIKPYPCGPEPKHHSHYGPADSRGWRNVERIDIPETQCPECCEPAGAES